MTTKEHSTIPQDLVGMLDLLAETIVQALGFGVAVVNLTRPDGSLAVVSVAGDDDARRTLLGTTDTAQRWERLLAASEHWGRLRFREHGTELDTEELFSWVPTIEILDAEDAWHPEDALFAPLVGEDGALLGVLSVDLPKDGLRPSRTTCHALEAFAVSAALAIEHATMRQRAEVSEKAFRQQATHDSLTGIANRALFEDRLRHSLARRPAAGTMTALVFIDLDRFKLINDLHSHATGDNVLRVVAERIHAAIRPHDTVARWGGDEFLVLLEGLPDEATAIHIVQRISASLLDPVTSGNLRVSVSASMGVSCVSVAEPCNSEELIRRADAAMYEVKYAGGGGYAAFHPNGRPAGRRQHLLNLLSRALNENRVVVHYQPIVRVSDRGVMGVEALVRLRDDDEALVPPLDFLSLARDGGTLLPIEHEVIRQACDQGARWVADGFDLRVSVNVCAEQLRRIEDFEAIVDKALTSSGLAADRLVCEITEHTLVDVTAATVAGIERLVARGVRISIDDFGTGFGSLSYIQALSIQELKIDRSFVASSAPATTAIVRSIAGLAADLGMNCVAEGVETLEQHELVRQSGVPHAQGFLYGRPAAPEALTSWLLGDPAHRAGECRTAVSVT